MCKYCEQGLPIGDFCAIRGGRTFTGCNWVSGDTLYTSILDNDAGTGDVDYTFVASVRIDFCPVCGRELEWS